MNGKISLVGEHEIVINNLQLQRLLLFIVLGTDLTLLSSDAAGETSNDEDIVG